MNIRGACLVAKNCYKDRLSKMSKQYFPYRFDIDNDFFMVEINHYDKTVYIGIRGSNDWKDWLSNLNISSDKIKSSVYGEAHKGFHFAAKKLERELKSFVNRYQQKRSEDLKKYKLQISAHSRGGPIGVLGLYRIQRWWRGEMEIYTFGAPRAFDTVPELEVRFRHIELVNQGDPVPGLPRKYMGYENYEPDIYKSLDTPWYLRIYLLRSFNHSINQYWKKTK